MNDQLHRTICDSPLGPIHLAATGQGLAALYFDPQIERMNKRLAARFDSNIEPSTSSLPDLPAPLVDVADALDRYWRGEIDAMDNLALDLRGSAFEMKVWDALKHIHEGETKSYGEIAREINHPRAARAVGAAIGRNPISIAVPCHRAVGANGSLTGYAGGLDRKQYLLNHEARLCALVG